MLISRTGYTERTALNSITRPAPLSRWPRRCSRAGAPLGLELAGLGARDSLRLEAGYPLYGHEITQDISPLTAGLAWTVKLDKGVDFIGRAALVAEKENGAPQKWFSSRPATVALYAPSHPCSTPRAPPWAGCFPGRSRRCSTRRLVRRSLPPRRPIDRSPWISAGPKLNLQIVKPPFVPLKKGSYERDAGIDSEARKP